MRINLSMILRRRSPLLMDWLMKCYEAQKGRPGAMRIKALENHLEIFLKFSGKRGKIRLKDIDRQFCADFAEYLASASNLRLRSGSNRPLSPNTQERLFSSFNQILNEAVRMGMIADNPVSKMEKRMKPKIVGSEKTFLSLEEIRSMQRHPLANNTTGRAFLFSCLTGMRWSDVKTLKWEQLHKEEDGSIYLIKQCVKTRKWIHIPICADARMFFPKKKSEGFVFDLPSASGANKAIKRWARAAGIKKNISFHTARHSFATMIITLGADIYTTSQLLGHSNISTTQIYARIVDKKKRQAVELLDGLWA